LSKNSKRDKWVTKKFHYPAQCEIRLFDSCIIWWLWYPWISSAFFVGINVVN